MKLERNEAKKIVNKLDFKNDLMPVVARDCENEEVLMVAFMNEKALLKTLTTGLVHYWSRSNNKLWLKGEKSKHIQKVREVRVDCDSDALLLDVEQEGGACHDGYRSCFYRKIEDGKFKKIMERLFKPEDVYSDSL